MILTRSLRKEKPLDRNLQKIYDDLLPVMSLRSLDNKIARMLHSCHDVDVSFILLIYYYIYKYIILLFLPESSTCSSRHCIILINILFLVFPQRGECRYLGRRSSQFNRIEYHQGAEAALSEGIYPS